jgi:transcriptional regulator with XRE-family HTH domain
MKLPKPRLNLKAAQGPFAEFVKRQRMEAGLTQRTLAEMTGVSFAFVQDVERGSIHLHLHKLITLLDFLGGQITVRERLPNETAGKDRP